MNKLIAILLSAALCLSLTACGESKPSQPKETDNPEVIANYPDDSTEQSTEENDALPPEQGSLLFVDKQGTEDVYSSLSILNNGGSYQVELSLFRAGYFVGTATTTQDGLFFTCDQGVSGIIRLEGETASFQVTESEGGAVSVGESWVFPERFEQIGQ